MNDTTTVPDTRAAERAAWLRSLRQASERQEDELAADYDARWGEIEPTHRVFVERFLAKLPPAGRVLDAPCGTGKYFPMVRASGRFPFGVDHSGAALRRAATKWPQVPTDKRALQELSYRAGFDGVMCVDAMEMVPPEDWPGILERFRLALRPGGWLYLTVELAHDDDVRAVNQRLRASGLPVVAGEVIWGEGSDAYYHFYPAMPRVRAWLAAAGFAIELEAEEPWHEEGYSYQHVLAHARRGVRPSEALAPLAVS